MSGSQSDINFILLFILADVWGGEQNEKCWGSILFAAGWLTGASQLQQGKKKNQMLVLKFSRAGGYM